MSEIETKWVIIWLEKVRDICEGVKQDAINGTTGALDRPEWMTRIDVSMEISQRVKRLMIEAIGDNHGM